MINEKALKAYLKKEFPDALGVDIRKLGEGVQGAGFLIEVQTPEGIKSYVIKGLFPEGLEHDYPSDRAGVFLLDLDEFKNLPKHVKALDVLAEMENGSIRSIGGGREYYLLMERAEGRHYFHDLSAFAGKERLEDIDIAKIKTMTSYLAEIHSVKKESRHLYWRKIRDTIGHGECLMGVFDAYPDGTITYEEIAEIEKKCVDWRMKLKPKVKRLCRIHGDFHPGNIWFKEESGVRSQESGDAELITHNSKLLTPPDFVLLDRSRGPWGEAADDVTALTINYIFFSINHYGKVHGHYLEALKLFYDDYITETGDTEILKIVAPFYAFRGAVVANPVFYPDVLAENRRKIFNFVRGVLDDESFKIEKVNEYLK
ncbi:MAG: aminoglycoside phosphotransferase family protein [Nitrospiraceae bacterium]|nr:MAG: aminoglycoside phosphotransferase family protein [Nitrospiraceae bacterium]